jgi:hypothetical protein
VGPSPPGSPRGRWLGGLPRPFSTGTASLPAAARVGSSPRRHRAAPNAFLNRCPIGSRKRRLTAASFPYWQGGRALIPSAGRAMI